MNATETSVPMKSVKQKTRGFVINFLVPATAADFDTLIGEGAAYGHAIDESIYRSLLPKTWKKVMELAPKRFGVPLDQVGTKKSKRNPDAPETAVYEDIKLYLPKLKAACADKMAELTAFVQDCATSVGFDLSNAGRVSKPSKEYYEKADDLLQKITRGETTAESSGAKFAARGIEGAYVVKDTKEDGTIIYDRDVLASAIRDFFAADDSLA